MNFCTQVKDELGGLSIKSPCCRKAFLYGILLRAEIPEDGDTLSLALPVIRDAAYDLPGATAGAIRQMLGREAVIVPETHGAHRYARLTFSSRQAAGILRHLAALPMETCPSADEMTPSATAEQVRQAVGLRCPSCATHLLRGAFLSCGLVNDPERSFHLEYRLPDDGRTACVLSLFREASLTPGVSRCEGNGRLFFKNAQALQDVLAYLGGVSAVFRVVNIQMTHDVLRQEHRATNWEAANIRRSVGAGGRHQVAIRGLMEHGLLAALPAELQETAQLRLLHPEMSLAELAIRHDPPITKSGLNHRLEKLLAVWETFNRGS